LPESWQFLGIGVGNQSFGNFSAPLLPPDDYLNLATQVSWEGLSSALLSNVSSNMRLKSFGGWLPPSQLFFGNTYALSPPRTCFRAIAMAQLSKLASKIQDKHHKLSSPNAPAELKEATRLLGGSIDGEDGNPTALVITSLVGGSGSSMFLDVAEVLKSIDPRYQDRTHLFLYGPDVFQLLEGLVGSMIPANALAASAEVMAGLWAEGPGEGSAEIFQRAGLTGRGTKGFGAKYTYIIGASNTNGVSFGNMDDVFHATGESLTSLIANEEVNTWLFDLLAPGIFDLTSVIVNDATRLKTPGNTHHNQPFNAIGFGRVSLGLDRFIDYLAEGGTRLIIENLLWPKYHPTDATNTKTPTELVETEANNIFPEFLEATGLDERDPKNDVNDALTPVGQEDRVRQFVNTILKNAAINVEAAGLASSEWIREITNKFERSSKTFEVEEAGHLYATAQNWTEDIQDKIISATSLMAARVGLQVAVRLVQKLREEVSFTANEELPVTASAKLRKLSGLSAGLSAKMPAGSGKVQAAAMNQMLGPILKEPAELIVDATRMNLAVEIMLDLDANLLSPLEESLRNNEILLRDAVDAKFNVNNEPNTFPSLTNLRTKSVPARFNASVVERLLIPTSSYPHEVERLVKESVVEENRTNWIPLLTERMALGTAIDEQGANEKPDLIIVQGRWIPQKKEIRKYDLGQQKAHFNLLTDPIKYFYKARDLLLSPKTTRTELGKYLKQDLATFLSASDPKKLTERRQQFLTAFEEAIDLAAPLVRINTALTALVHSNINPSDRYLHMSAVPFPDTGDSQPIYTSCKAILQRGQLWSNDFEKQFKVASGVQEIDFFSTLQKPMTLMVFDSIMGPAYKFWNEQIGNSAAMHGYWTMRRARPLSEFIPAAPEVVHQIIIGWFISILLGQRKVEDDKLKGPKISVWDSEEKDFISFPHPMLPIGSYMKRIELLPTMLESLVLAFTECNNSNSLDPLRAYWRLIDLGLNYQAVMSDWIANASLEADAPTPDEIMAGAAGGDFEDRKTALLKILNQTKLIYFESFEKESLKNDPFALSLVFELKDQISSALDEIYTFIDEMHLKK
jgi:hypothetical protein